jgi:hypothetical protein
VHFSKLTAWSVGSQFAISWSWPDASIGRLGSVLARRLEPALGTLSPSDTVTLLTIRFDGSIEARDPVQIGQMKGKLYRAHPGDVVFSKIDVRNGAIGLAPDYIECMCVTSEFPVYSVDTSAVSPEYVKLLFRTVTFKRLLNSMVSGTSGRKRIQPDQLEGLRVPFPPKAIQRKIVGHWTTAKAELTLAEAGLLQLEREVNDLLVREVSALDRVTRSPVLLANFSNLTQWDLKSGRAAAFISANPRLVRLGEFTEECTETVRPWESDDKEWPVYGVSNRDGVFLSGLQLGSKFNAPYKKIQENWFFHNPTRANVGSLGIVPKVPVDAIASPEYQVWRLVAGFRPEFMALVLRTRYFLAMVAINRVGGVKQRMYYQNLADIRLPQIPDHLQLTYVEKRMHLRMRIQLAREVLLNRQAECEQMIVGTRPTLDI